jgi:hypothetical protein
VHVDPWALFAAASPKQLDYRFMVPSRKMFNSKSMSRLCDSDQGFGGSAWEVHVQDAYFSVMSRASISDDEEAPMVRRSLLTFALVGALAAPQGVSGQTMLSWATNDAGSIGPDLGLDEALGVREEILTSTDPQPMSVLLVSTGLLGVFVVRRGKLGELEIDES